MPRKRKPTDADRIREYDARHPGQSDAEIAAVLDMSRQAVQSARSKSATRGRPSTRIVLHLDRDLLAWLDAWVQRDDHESRAAAIEALILRERAESAPTDAGTGKG